MKKFCVTILILIITLSQISFSVDNHVENDIGNGKTDDRKTEEIANIKTSYGITVSGSPISILTEDTIKKLNLNMPNNLSDKEKADYIKMWQNTNMIYIKDTKYYPNVSDPMRWNYMLSAIYTVEDMLKMKTTDGKYYGICYQYATIYASIANYYSLDVRVTSMKEKPSELPEVSNVLNTITANGMSADEYNRYAIFSKEKKLKVYPYDAIRLIAKETSTHYRAEVKLNGKWIPYDGSTSDPKFIENYSFFEVNWYEGEENDKLADYIKRLNNGESLKNVGYNSVYEQFMEGRMILLETGEAEKYIGITDSIGQKNRSKNIDDFMQGKGFLPYIDNPRELLSFLKLNNSLMEDVIEGIMIRDLYEKQTGRRYYILAHLMLSLDLEDDEMPDMDKFAEQYVAMTGEQIDAKTAKKIIYAAFAEY